MVPCQPSRWLGLLRPGLHSHKAAMHSNQRVTSAKSLVLTSTTSAPACLLCTMVKECGQQLSSALSLHALAWVQSCTVPPKRTGLLVPLHHVCPLCLSWSLLWATVFNSYICAALALQEVEAALQGSQGTASKQLKQLHGRCMLQLEDLVELIRGPLSDLERKVRCPAQVAVTAEYLHYTAVESRAGP